MILNSFLGIKLYHPLLLQVAWGESSMIEAERLLLAAALKDPANQRFVLLSDRFVSLTEDLVLQPKEF